MVLQNLKRRQMPQCRGTLRALSKGTILSLIRITRESSSLSERKRWLIEFLFIFIPYEIRKIEQLPCCFIHLGDLLIFGKRDNPKPAAAGTLEIIRCRGELDVATGFTLHLDHFFILAKFKSDREFPCERKGRSISLWARYCLLVCPPSRLSHLFFCS